MGSRQTARLRLACPVGGADCVDSAASADRGSAIITGQPSKLASALVKISGRMQRIPDQDLRQVEVGNTLMFFPAISRGSISEIFSTHPSLEHRIAKLPEMEANLAR